jgi:hypothetical protein
VSSVRAVTARREAGSPETESDYTALLTFEDGAAELMELADALAGEREPFLDAAWGRATLEVCVAILESGAQRRELTLNYQFPANAVGTW